MQVSRAAKTLDEELEIWRNRPLGKTPYLFLDARYESVRQGGVVRDAAIIIATRRVLREVRQKSTGVPF